MKNKILSLSFPLKLALIFVISFLLWLAYNQFFTKKTASVQYQTATAQKGSLVVSLSASGQVSNSNSRTVTTTASGVVKKVFVKEGQKVTTGTALLSIDLDLDGRQKLQSAYSQYLSAQNNLKTTQDRIYTLESTLINTKNIFNNQWASQSPDDPTYQQKHNDLLAAQAAYDNLQSSVKQAQTSLEAARLAYQLAGSVVYAPISGTIGSISLTPGMILNPTSNSSNSSNLENKIAIVKTSALPSVTVNLTEIDVPKIKVGNQVTVTFDALADKTFTGKIIAIDTTGTVSSNVVNYPTTIQLDSDVPGLFTNMSANINIIIDFKDNVIIVPNSAIKTSDNVSTIQIMKDNQPQLVTVITGISNDTHTEIVSGVSEGDLVVTNTTNTATTTKATTSPFSSFGGGARMIGR